MKLTKERREELDKIVKEYLDKENINMKEDIFQQLDKLGFDVRSAPLRAPLSGIILVNEKLKKLDGYDKNKIIVYNSDIDLNLYKLRFVLSHELSHYIEYKNQAKNDDIILAARDHTERYSYDIAEQEKDYMAAALLVPKDEFIKDMTLRLEYLGNKTNNLSNDSNKNNTYLKLIDDLYFVQSMQKKYRVEEELVKRRIEEISDMVG